MKKSNRDSYQRKIPDVSSKSQTIHLENGNQKAKSKQSELQENIHTEDTTLKNLSVVKQSKKKSERKSSIPESQLEDKKKISIDNQNYLEKNVLLMNLLQILDQASISKEKDLKPFWNSHSKANSKKLWLPIKTDYVDSDLTCLNSYLRSSQMLKSWFSINLKLPQTKNFQKISYQSLQYSQLKSMEEKDTKERESKKIKKESKKTKKLPSLKTIKVRIFPDTKQKKIITEWEGTSRWVWNHSLWILRLLTNSPIYQKNKPSFTKFKVKNIKIRDFLDKIKTESEIEVDKNYIYEFVNYIYDETRNKTPELPKGFPVRAYRGMLNELTQAINSLVSNKGNLNNIKIKSKKDDRGLISFESWATKYIFPSALKGIKGYFKIGRKKMDLSELSKKIIEVDKKRSFSIQRDGKKYFLLLPIENSKLRIIKDEFKGMFINENQVNKHPLIVLDTGVRTFQTGYCLNHAIEIGSGDLLKLQALLEKKDLVKSKKRKLRIQKRINNLVNELHWKTIGFLTKNYDTIVIPEFPVSKMVRGHKLKKITKRLMYTFKFYQFKERLKIKCIDRGCKLHIVDESFTSKTCGKCGKLNNELGASKIFECPSCGIVIDRDINGARNILIKTFLCDSPALGA